jgi:hypothetical protein
MNERNGMQDMIEVIIISLLSLIVITYICFSAGIVTLPEKQSPEIPQPSPTITPVQTSTVTTWTPEPTPAAIPTLEADYIDPFAPGQRSQGQWFKFYRSEVQGLKNLQVGIIAYRSKFLDRYTWYNPSTGNYFSQRPATGNRYFAVWVNQEMIGETITEDPSFWAFDERAFAVQVGNELFTTQNNVSYSPVIRIKEFDDYTTYDDAITAPPFGYYVRYTAVNPEAGGYAAEKLGWLRLGKPIDGFLLFEVPRESQLRDMQLLGEFGTFGKAAWKLDTTTEYHKIITPR